MGTASNAYNRPGRISPALRDRVLAAASALGYGGPDPVARRLRTGRTGTVGLLFTAGLPFAFGDQAAVAFLGGVAEGLQETGDALLVVPAAATDEIARHVVQSAAVDGFIAYSNPTGDARLEAALGRGLPMVAVDQPRDLPVPFVGIDDRGAALAAAAHLRNLGHERIAVLAFAEAADPGGRRRFEVTAQRLAGYRAGLGPVWREELVRTCRPNSVKEGERATLDLLGAQAPPTAVLAMSDALAAGALAACRTRGVAVPAGLSVVGFDDSPLAGTVVPALTTVAQPLAEKGLRAARMLTALIEGQAQSAGQLLSAHLELRDTTAPPAGR